MIVGLFRGYTVLLPVFLSGSLWELVGISWYISNTIFVWKWWYPVVIKHGLLDNPLLVRWFSHTPPYIYNYIYIRVGFPMCCHIFSALLYLFFLATFYYRVPVNYKVSTSAAPEVCRHQRQEFWDGTVSVGGRSRCERSMRRGWKSSAASGLALVAKQCWMVTSHILDGLASGNLT